MPRDDWPPGSFEARALQAARARRAAAWHGGEDRLGRARRAREARFARLMAAVFEDRWSWVPEPPPVHVTAVRYGALCFALVDVEGQRNPVLSVSVQCPRCARTFEQHPVHGRADVGDVLAQLQEHQPCSDPEVVAEAEHQGRG